MLNAKDIVRDVLEKDPKERTDEDIDILFEFMQSFPVDYFYIIANFLIIFRSNNNNNNNNISIDLFVS